MQTAPAKPSIMTTFVVPILIVLAIGAGVGLAGYGIKQVIAPPVSTSTTSTTAAQTTVVSMPSGVGSTQSLNFSPANVTIAKGGKVTWNNNDTLAHTVTSTSVPSGASTFNSGNMVAGESFSQTFTVDGTYNYVCSYHPWMHGTVTVTG